MSRGKHTGKLVIGLVLLLAVGLVAAACGGDDEELAAPAPAAPAAAAAESVAEVALAEAGYADGLELELVSSTSSAPWMAIVTAYKEEAAVAGIDVTIKMAPADGYWSEVWLRVPFSMSEWGWRAAEQVLNEMFRCGGGWNEGAFCDSEYDRYLDAAGGGQLRTAEGTLYGRPAAPGGLRPRDYSLLPELH